jgi:hypothetical protein
MKDPELCEKISQVVPKTLTEVYRTSEILEDNGISSKYLNDEYIENKAYYHYEILHKYVLRLYFENKKLKFLMVFKGSPEKAIICEKELL